MKATEKWELAGIEIRPGDIVSVCTNTFFGKLTRMALGTAYEDLTGDDRENCPSHDGIVIEHDGELFIGDAMPPVCRRTRVWQYQVNLLDNVYYTLRIFRPDHVNNTRRRDAAKWWDDNVCNSPYDTVAFPRLLLKAIFGDWFPQAAGLRWARWCTEGVKDAYKNGAKHDIYENENPTPLTTIKRWKMGELKCLNAEN